jgi:hypothetical protein
MPLPMPPELPPGYREKNLKVFRYADLLGYVLSLAHSDDHEIPCAMLGEIAATHAHPQPMIGHRRCVVVHNGQEIMLTMIASLPENVELTPGFVADLLRAADAEQEKAKARN